MSVKTSPGDDHEKEISRLQGKLSLAASHVDRLDGQKHALERQALRLANALGFETVDAAEYFINMADEWASYKQLLERLDNTQMDLSRERQDNEKLRAQVQELQVEMEALRSQSGGTHNALLTLDDIHPLSPQSANSLQKQLNILRHRYDELQTVKSRADEKHKADFRKFLALKEYMQSPPIREMEKRLKTSSHQLTKEERRRRRAEINALIVDKIDHLDVKEDGVHDTVSKIPSNKENQQTPIPKAGRRLLPFSTPPRPQIAFPSVANTGKLLVPNSSDTEQNFDSASRPLPSLNISPVANAHPDDQSGNSSDTEPDTQEPYPLVKTEPPPLTALLSRAADDPEDDCAPKVMEPPATQDDVKPRLDSLLDAVSLPQSKQRHSDGGSSANLSVMRDADSDRERPHKIRRVSTPRLDDHFAVPGSSAATPLYVSSGDTPRGKRNRGPSISTRKREKSAVKDHGQYATPLLNLKEETRTPIMNARASSSKQLTDYSAYKGRGRYANDGAGGDVTINTRFGINPAQNGGRDFQYDEAVRGGEERRQLHGGDCECCRDYYDRVGPMPERLQPPLWRTPPDTPESALKEVATEVASHKQAISRHRHQWERPKTPPAYWTIGFPSTQQVVTINEQAREMHRQKQNKVQEEADRQGGRYYKKGKKG